MKYIIQILSLILISNILLAQSSHESVEIDDMKWGSDYDLHISMSNDSNYIYNIKALYHYDTENYNVEQFYEIAETFSAR